MPEAAPTRTWHTLPARWTSATYLRMSTCCSEACADRESHSKALLGRGMEAYRGPVYFRMARRAERAARHSAVVGRVMTTRRVRTETGGSRRVKMGNLRRKRARAAKERQISEFQI